MSALDLEIRWLEKVADRFKTGEAMQPHDMIAFGKGIADTCNILRIYKRGLKKKRAKKGLT